MASFISRVLKNVAYAVAFLIIAGAVLVVASRFVTPVLDEHKADFEKIASQLMQNQVSINNVRVSWFQYQPVFNLNGVTILDKSTHQPALQIQKVSIFFSIPKSIWQFKLVPSGIMVDGTDIDIDEPAKGEIKVRGFPSLGGFQNQPYKNESRLYDVAAFISQQPRLILRNIDVRYTDFIGKQRDVTLFNLDFQNDGSHHVVFGKAILHQEMPTEITIAGQWEGNPQELDPSQIKAKAYIYISGLSLPQWAKGYTWQGWQVQKGLASAKIWASWNQGSFKKIQTTYEFYGLHLYSQTDKTVHKINRFSGNAGWRHDGKNVVLAGDDILIDLPTHLWPVTSFYVSLIPDQEGKLKPKAANIGYIDLEDVQALIFSSPLPISAATRDILNGIHLQGGLQNTTLTFNGAWYDWQHTGIHAHFSQLSFSPWKKFPGINKLSGSAQWDGQEGEMILNTKQSTFKYGSVFANDVNIDQLSGNVFWSRLPNQVWQMRFNSLQLLNLDLAANAEGTLTIPADASPIADITANIAVKQAKHAAQYLPLKVFSPDLVKWLSQAFLAGEAQSGHAVLRGPVNDFPFKNGTGTFQISGVVKDVDLRYAPTWPILRHINGKLNFIGNKMTADIEQAETFNVHANNLHAEIPDLSNPILSVVSGDINTDFRHALNFVHVSPLEKTLGNMFSSAELSGPIVLSLDLTIPLDTPDNINILGKLDIIDSEMKMTPWNLALTHLQGQINFTENSTTAENLKGELFNKPFSFSLATIQKKKGPRVVEASFKNHLAITDVEAWLKLPLAQILQGSADFTGALDFAFNTPIELQLKSNLVGIAVNLPYEYSKLANEETEFSLDLIAKEKQPLKLKLGYDDMLSAALILDKKKDKFNLIGADLRLGTGVAEWPTNPGLYLSGNFDKLDWDQIKKYLAQSTSTGTTAFTNLKLRGIDFSVKKLGLSGLNFDNIRIQVSPTQNYWNINVNSADVIGQLNVPVKFSAASTLSAQFQKLTLRTDNNSPSSSIQINSKTLPAISFSAKNVSYNDTQLGQVAIKTVSGDGGLTIQSLRVGSPRMDLQATGDWTSGNVTHLRGKINSNQLSALLSDYGFDVRNFIAQKGALTFNLNWKDAPYSPAFANLNGTATLDVGPGRVVDIGKESGAKMGLGQLLNIFSLQSIPRRLTLDFSDIFQKGYSFDYIRGDFTLQNGDLYTNNLRFDGPVAKVDLNGHIGLNNKVYNLVLSVTAYVTSSIPIAATLLTGNPLIGLGAFAVNSVIGSQVSKVTTHYYSVTGPWSNPVWATVNGNSRRS